MSDLLRVVAAAIITDGRVLAARRSRPSALAGGWEFAGGKVEPSESDEGALRRELQEELAIDVRVGELLGVARDARIELYLYRAASDTDAPEAGEDHDDLRWVDSSELDDVGWLPIDQQLLDAVRAALMDP